jgi:epoxyqueuosine reductase
VNVSSIASIRWLGTAYIGYAASKAAVNQFTQAIAMQYAGKGIRANAILPGMMNTPTARASLGSTFADEADLVAKRNAACPTGAIHAPYQLDARRCIAYLTIEHKGSIPEEFRSLIGDRLYGCDDCLDVCPWNRWARETRESGFRERGRPELVEMLGWEKADFDRHFQGTPVHRLKLSRWKRNICVVLGNIGGPSDRPALADQARGGDPLVAEHAAWALKKLECSNRS